MRALRPEGEDEFAQRDEFTTQLLEKNNLLQREKDDLEVKLEKLRISSETEINIEKKHHEKTILELAKTKHENRELEKKVQHLENRLQQRGQEDDEFQSRSEMRSTWDQKFHPRETAIFQDFIGKSPVSSSPFDAKVISLIKVFQDQKEILEEENRNLKKEMDRLHNILNKTEEENLSMKKEYGQSYDKLSREVATRVAAAESENTSLYRDNQLLRERLERQDHERVSLREENAELRRKYEDLKNRYYAIDLGTPNKSDNTKGTDDSTPKSNVVKPTKSFTTSKKPEFKSPDLEAKYSSASQQYGGGSDLGALECKKLVNEILDIFNLSNPGMIIPSIKKTEKVMQAIPKLQKLLAEIANIVFSKGGPQTTENQVEMIIPCLKAWASSLEELEDLKELKGRLIEKIGLVKDSENSDIIKSVDDLLYISFQHQEVRTKAQREANDNVEHKMIIDQLTKILGGKPTVHSMKQMMVQLTDLKHFINLVKSKLNLNPEMSNEACLTHLLKFLESQKSFDQAFYITSKLQKMLDCSIDHVLPRIEDLINDNQHLREASYGYRRPY